MRRSLQAGFVAVVVTILVAGTAFASSVHLKGGPNAEPAFADHGLTLAASGALSGLGIILKLLRDNGKTSRQVAYHGVYQSMLTTTKVAQLLRLSLGADLPCVPEISANKYALNIRFIGLSGMDRGNVVDQNVEFELTFCNL